MMHYVKYVILVSDLLSLLIGDYNKIPLLFQRQEHISIIPVSQEVVIDKCVADNCCDGKVHCPFCDTDHFKPTKPTRVRDHLELLHMSYAVQAEGKLQNLF